MDKGGPESLLQATVSPKQKVDPESTRPFWHTKYVLLRSMHPTHLEDVGGEIVRKLGKVLYTMRMHQEMMTKGSRSSQSSRSWSPPLKAPWLCKSCKALRALWALWVLWALRAGICKTQVVEKNLIEEQITCYMSVSKLTTEAIHQYCAWLGEFVLGHKMSGRTYINQETLPKASRSWSPPLKALRALRAPRANPKKWGNDWRKRIFWIFYFYLFYSYFSNRAGEGAVVGTASNGLWLRCAALARPKQMTGLVRNIQATNEMKSIQQNKWGGRQGTVEGTWRWRPEQAKLLPEWC